MATARKGLPAILEDAGDGLPGPARDGFAEVYERFCECHRRVAEYDRRIKQLARAGDYRQFPNGRQFAASLGPVARQCSCGGKARHGRITKRGDVDLRTLLIRGTRALMRHLSGREDRNSRWVLVVKERRGFNKAAVALAAKHTRYLWVLSTHGRDYQASTA